MATLIIVAGLCALATASAAREVDVDLQAGVQMKAPDRYSLHFRILNRGRESITLFNRLLPWDKESRLWISAIGIGRSGEFEPVPVRGFVALGHSTPRLIELKNGGVIEGDVSLNYEYPGLVRSLKEQDVVIFWSYRLFCEKRRYSKRFGGWLVIPRIEAK